MNIIILGIFALNQQGIDGSILQMINHAVIMAGLFFVVAMMYARSGTRRLDEMSGLAKAFPVMAAFRPAAVPGGYGPSRVWEASPASSRS